MIPLDELERLAREASPIPTVTTYCGKLVTEMTREELISALNHVCREQHEAFERDKRRALSGFEISNPEANDFTGSQFADSTRIGEA